MSWAPTPLLTQGDLATMQKALTLDPSLFQADTAEQRSFLKANADILSLSPQEYMTSKYLTIKGIYMSCPSFIRLLITLIFIIAVVVVVPILLITAYKAAKTKGIELASTIVLILLTIWIYRSWVRDL